MSNQKITPLKPFLLYMYGFPGAGKTAFARQLTEELNIAHLQQDRLTQELLEGNGAAAEKLSRKTMEFMAREFLRAGISVIYDTNLQRLSDRRKLRDAARAAKAVPVMIWLQVDAETAFQREQKRDRRKSDDHYARGYTPEQFEAYMNNMQNPFEEQYIVISGKHTFNTQRAAVIKKFYELGILSPSQLNQSIAKPELVNLVPQASLGGTPQIPRRNINIR